MDLFIKVSHLVISVLDTYLLSTLIQQTRKGSKPAPSFMCGNGSCAVRRAHKSSRPKGSHELRTQALSSTNHVLGFGDRAAATAAVLKLTAEYFYGTGPTAAAVLYDMAHCSLVGNAVLELVVHEPAIGQNVRLMAVHGRGGRRKRLPGEGKLISHAEAEGLAHASS